MLGILLLNRHNNVEVIGIFTNRLNDARVARVHQINLHLIGVAVLQAVEEVAVVQNHLAVVAAHLAAEAGDALAQLGVG